jgi:hypothetical protein
MTQQMSARDHQAWARILDDIENERERLNSLRIRIAHELGFERCKVTDLRADDRIRNHGDGLWYTVAYVLPPSAAPTDDVPQYRIMFADDEGMQYVEAEWDGNPSPPMVTRAVVVDQEPF